MSCPRCGEVCHCYPELRPAFTAHPRPRFEVDGRDCGDALPATLVDPEGYDATEEQFSASLDRPSPPRFIPNEEIHLSATQASIDATVPDTQFAHPARCADSDRSTLKAQPENAEAAGVLPATGPVSGNSGQSYTSSPPSCPDEDPDAWKRELAAKLDSYRARRKPRPPKYPSLALNFEPAPLPAPRPPVRNAELASALAMEEKVLVNDGAESEVLSVLPADPPPSPVLPTGRLIEFPRLFEPEEESPDQLAEPICEQPRILEAPEVELPAPALGGIVLETPPEPQVSESRPGIDIPLRSARLSRRLMAAAIDAIIVAAAVLMFGFIFLKLTKSVPPVAPLLVWGGIVASILVAAYQYLLLTYSGATPGLRLAKLRLMKFDGESASRSNRRWRVLASILSGASLGLGFAWCFLDEDGLCWHDRITQTHLISLD